MATCGREEPALDEADTAEGCQSILKTLMSCPIKLARLPDLPLDFQLHEPINLFSCLSLL